MAQPRLLWLAMLLPGPAMVSHSTPQPPPAIIFEARPGTNARQSVRPKWAVWKPARNSSMQPAIRHFGLESSVRPSLAFYNTREEVDTLVLALRSLKRN